MKVNSFTKNGIKFTEVNNDLGFKVIFANLGASIYLVRYGKYVFNRNVKEIEDFKIREQYFGKTIGRTSNRLKGHKFKLNGNIFELEPNEGKNVLHGGKYGLSCMFFDEKVVSNLDETVLTYETSLCNDGYPGTLNVKVTYIVPRERNEIEIRYEAESDEDTLCSLTNHAYWTLGCENISGLTLQIEASKYLKTTEDELLPVSIETVTDALDFRDGKVITRDIEKEELHNLRLNGYDHFYYFDEIDPSLEKAVLNNNKFKMHIFTDYEGIQIYTHGFDNGKPLYPDANYLYNSVAIEPSDSFMKLHLLKKNEVYSRFIRYIFDTEN